MNISSFFQSDPIAREFLGMYEKDWRTKGPNGLNFYSKGIGNAVSTALGGNPELAGTLIERSYLYGLTSEEAYNFYLDWMADSEIRARLVNSLQKLGLNLGDDNHRLIPLN